MVKPAIELSKVRKRAGLSQRELARRVHVPQSTVARIESGVMSPSVETLESLLQACGYRLTLSRIGEGIDRTVIRELLEKTPAQLFESAVSDARNLDDLLSSIDR